jgi:hypothetical protein
MIDYTSLKLSGSGVKLKEGLEKDVKNIINKVSDKRMDYLTEIVKAANAERTGVDIYYNGVQDLSLPDEPLAELLALVGSCDETGAFKAGAEISGQDLADEIEKMLKELANLKDDYLIVFSKEPSLYRIFHTDKSGFHDRAFTVYEKQAERIEAQLKAERGDLIYEQLKLLEGIDNDKKRERCEGNIKAQEEIIADLETELEAVNNFGGLRMELLKTRRDLRWERSKEDADNKKIKEYLKAIEKLNFEKSREKYKGYCWSYINDDLSETAAGNDKAMKKIPEAENEVLPYVKEMLENQKKYNVLAVGTERLEESLEAWHDNENMKAAKKDETEAALENNFAETEQAIRDAIKDLEEKNELLLWQYHETVKIGNSAVESKFASAGAGGAFPEIKGADEIQRLAEQLSLKKSDELPEPELVYLDDSAAQELPLLFGNLKTEVKLPDVRQSMFEFDEEQKRGILRNMLKTAQKEYNRQENDEYIRSYLEKGKELRVNAAGSD